MNGIDGVFGSWGKFIMHEYDYEDEVSDITFVRLDSQFLGLEFTSLKYVFGDDFMDISKIGFRQGTGYVYVYN
nr:hypothetical protein BaRGS_032294 [Batillaria attramentaria]